MVGRRTKERRRTVFRRTTFSLAFLPSLPLFLTFLCLSREGEGEPGREGEERIEEGYDKNTPCGVSTVEVYRMVKLHFTPKIEFTHLCSKTFNWFDRSINVLLPCIGNVD